jgi:hypothetical protein
MPIVSRFFGIVIAFYWEDHALPISTPSTAETKQ